MKKFLLLLIMGVLVVPSLVLASTIREESNIASTETVQDNLYLTGSSPVVAGTVDGDLVGAGGNIVISGTVMEDAWLAGGNVNVSGDIQGDLRVFAGNIYLDGHVGGELMVLGGQVTIGSKTVIDGDLNAFGGKVDVNPTAIIRGKQTIDTEDTYQENKKDREEWNRFGKEIFWWGEFFSLLMGLTVVAMIFGFYRGFTQRVVIMALDQSQLGKNLGIGLLLLFVMPIAAFLLLVTGIGALLGGIMFLAYLLYILFSSVFAGITMGGFLYKMVKKPKKFQLSWFWVVVGVVVLHLLHIIPVLGWLICAGLFLVSGGALMQVKWQIAKKL